MIPIHKKYFDSNKKNFVYILNNIWNKESEKKIDLKDIDYKFLNFGINNKNNEHCDEYDDEHDDIKNNDIQKIQENKTNETKELFHLNINHLGTLNNFVDDYDKLKINNTSEFIKKIKEIYLDQTDELKSNDDTRYKIISETTKIELDIGTKHSHTVETDNNKYISTTLLNPWKLYDGITNLTILTDNSKYIIENIKIRTRAKNLNDNIYRDIKWDLEFEECEEGYKILGLDNFIHIGLVGLEEIFLDIIYDMCIDELEESNELNKLEKNDLGWFGWLKFTQCYYNDIIKQNLKKNLYTNEESYSVDIVDYIWIEKINLQKEEQMFGNMYGTNYNDLRITLGMSGLVYSN